MQMIKAMANVMQRLDHLIDVSTHGQFEIGFLGRREKAFLMKTGFSDGRTLAAGGVIDAEGAVTETAAFADVSERGHHRAGTGAGQAIFGTYAGENTGLFYQAIISQRFDGVGNFKVLRIEDIFEQCNRREAAVDDAIRPRPWHIHRRRRFQPRTPSR